MQTESFQAFGGPPGLYPVPGLPPSACQSLSSLHTARASSSCSGSSGGESLGGSWSPQASAFQGAAQGFDRCSSAPLAQRMASLSIFEGDGGLEKVREGAGLSEPGWPLAGAGARPHPPCTPLTNDRNAARHLRRPAGRLNSHRPGLRRRPCGLGGRPPSPSSAAAALRRPGRPAPGARRLRRPPRPAPRCARQRPRPARPPGAPGAAPRPQPCPWPAAPWRAPARRRPARAQEPGLPPPLAAGHAGAGRAVMPARPRSGACQPAAGPACPRACRLSMHMPVCWRAGAPQTRAARRRSRVVRHVPASAAHRSCPAHLTSPCRCPAARSWATTRALPLQR